MQPPMVLDLLLLAALACTGVDPARPPATPALPPATPSRVFVGRAGPDTVSDMEHFEIDLDLDAGHCRIARFADNAQSVEEAACTGTETSPGRWKIHLQTAPPKDLDVTRFDALPPADQQRLVDSWLAAEPDTGVHDPAKMRARLAGSVLLYDRVYR